MIRPILQLPITETAFSKGHQRVLLPLSHCHMQADLVLKRAAQESGYNYLPPKNPLQLPRGQKSQNNAGGNSIVIPDNIITLIENIENPTTLRFPGRLVGHCGHPLPPHDLPPLPGHRQ